MSSDTHRTTTTLAWRLALGAVAVGLCLGLGVGPVWSPSLAHAQSDDAKKKATAYYKQGTTQFKLGNFDEAIELFKKAYETSPHHAFLFNLGQAYRQKGDCKQAIFFYKGYLTEAGAKAKNRALVESHIRELREICQATEDSKDKPPDGALDPLDDAGGGDSKAPGADPGTGDAQVAEATDGGVGDSTAIRGGGDLMTGLESWQPSLVSATVIAGPALLGFGERLQVAGAQPSFSLSVGYPLHFGKLGITLGGAFTYTPVPWETNGVAGTSTLISALANIGVRYRVIDKLSIGADVGAGGLFLGGLSSGNIFLPPEDMATGALTMPNVRIGVGADYLLTDQLMVSAAPFVFSTSPPKDGLRQEVETLRRIEFMVGVGYRM